MVDQVVLLETALVKVALRTSFEYAVEYTPACLALVNLQMLLQVAATRKSLGTEVACEWLLASMDA